MTNSPSSSFSHAYSASIKDHIWQLIAWGYTDSRSRVSSTAVPEPDITGFIAEAINKRFKLRNAPKWSKSYSVHENKPEPSTTARAGNSRLKPDIVIQIHVSGRPEFSIEAKRLKSNGFPVSKYIGREGMGCFISENYACCQIQKYVLQSSLKPSPDNPHNNS